MASSWIFQANPSSYSIEESLANENEEFWNLRQHVRDVRSGDRVFVWISGDDAGVYAAGTVVSEPELREDSANGKKYWRLDAEKRRVRARVLVRYDVVLLHNPLFRDIIQWDPELEDISIIRNPRGTNFRLTSSEAKRLEDWVERAAHLPSVASPLSVLKP